jgi:hypothetical protein
MEAKIEEVRKLFEQAYLAPEKIAVVSAGDVQFAQPEIRKGYAQAAFAELLANAPEKWRNFWFLLEPTDLHLFRFEAVFAQGENQRWLYLMYLQFCQDYPAFAPVTEVVPLDDLL